MHLPQLNTVLSWSAHFLYSFLFISTPCAGSLTNPLSAAPSTPAFNTILAFREWLSHVYCVALFLLLAKLVIDLKKKKEPLSSLALWCVLSQRCRKNRSVEFRAGHPTASVVQKNLSGKPTCVRSLWYFMQSRNFLLSCETRRHVIEGRTTARARCGMFFFKLRVRFSSFFFFRCPFQMVKL